MSAGRTSAIVGVLLTSVVAAWQAMRSPPLILSGWTMGTSWSVRVEGPPRPLLRLRIQECLDGIESQLSTWRPDSNLSAFNRHRGTGWVDVPEHLAQVALQAREVSAATGGAFDITVFPLVEAWGFGPRRGSAPPSEEEADALRARVDWRELEVRADPPALRKRRPDLEIDVSGIAKGFAVDRVAAMLASLGFRDGLVEVGGELCAWGKSRRIAIEAPDGGKPSAIELAEAAAATSGDYRNARIEDGRRRSHILDPRTGRPASSGAASATAVHASCAVADAWATALIVLGPEGIPAAEKAGVAARLLCRRGAGFVEVSGSGFRRLTPP